jgi:sigma-E factor negative regulatory protein RseC
MLETKAIVIQRQGNEALVEAIQGGGCGHCDSEKGCGSGKLSQLFCSEPRRFRVRNNANAQVGDMVQVVLGDGLLLRSALLMYILPLLLLMIGAAAGTQLSSEERVGEVYSAIGGLVGLISGFLIVKFVSSRRSKSSVALADILPVAETGFGNKH